MADGDLRKLEEEKLIGLTLALCSGVLIGTSFIITKKGLMDSNRENGKVAGEGFDYLRNSMWWAGTLTMISGEVANFLAYSYAPAILVTPLGAVSVLVGAVLSWIFLNEKLGKDGVIGCILCVLGSLTVILHAPEEAAIENVEDVFRHFTQPSFLTYMIFILAISMYLIYFVGPVYGKKHMLVYITICSLIGSISVMAVKGFAVGVKLTFAGENQFKFISTWVFGVTVVVCALTQVTYFNKALDLFSTNRVTPIYYVFFTSATIIASVILSQGFRRSSPIEIISVLVGFFTIFIGVFMVNDAKASNANASILDRAGSGSVRGSLSSVYRRRRTSKGEFYPLKNMDEAFNLQDDLTGQSKIQDTRLTS